MTTRRWWRNGVVYQIYPRSWVDSNRDGVGDLAGVTERLEYLRWLGVDAIWLNPITPSPNADWGYDVADYRGVHPDFGSLDDVDLLVKEAHAHDLAVVLDLVPNHTSDCHRWFTESRRSKDSAKRDWYVWAPPRADGRPPNNWVRAIGNGPAWTLDDLTGEYYMHSFLPEQPDLNWWNEDVRSAFDDIIRFWLERGIDGFRIDVVHALIHDPSLTENPPVTEEDHPQIRRIGQRQLYNMNRPEVHEIIKRWRRLSDQYPDRILIGETYLFDLAEVGRYYGEGGDELHLAFNFPFMFSRFDAAQLSGIIDTMLELLPEDASAAWAGSNHDAGRFVTRWCGNDEHRARLGLMLLLTLPGVAFLYYGDEIAQQEVFVPRRDLRDPAGIARWPDKGRDPGRTPMQWSPRPGAGFTAEDVEPWLPIGDTAVANVETQRHDADSMLQLARHLVQLRRDDPDIRDGGYERLTLDDGLWGYRRGRGIEVWLNMTDRTRSIGRGPAGIVADTTSTGVSLERDRLQLGPWEGAVLRTEVVD